MEDLKYLDTFSVQGFEIPSYSKIEEKLEDPNGPSHWSVEEVLNPIETFIYDNEPADREGANRQRRFIGQIIDYIVKNSVGE